MATKAKDITETGKFTARDLQKMNQFNLEGIDPSLIAKESDINERLAKENRIGPAQGIEDYYNRVGTVGDYLESSSLISQKTRTGDQDYWGRSSFDEGIVVGEQDWNRLGDIRAENQPWYSKIANGVGKAGVLAATTALETAGLLYGLGQGIADASDAEEGEGWHAFLHGLWDNPITNALQKINDASEDFMPNYYTQREQEGAFDFNANFLGDKLIKNLGFMVGAFYGGIPASSAIGKFGQAAVKGAREAQMATRQGMASRLWELRGQAARTGDNLDDLLTKAKLTEAERGAVLKEGLDKINDITKATRATTMTVGAVGSAINEGAIEALNNSKDWAEGRIRKANDEYTDSLRELDQSFAALNDEGVDDFTRSVAQAEYDRKKQELDQKHQMELEAIEKGRATMGNIDLLQNLPILIASNAYELGRLYTRGFDSTRRELGSLWNGHKLSGNLADGSLKSDKTWKGAVRTSLLKSNAEGMEELTQRMASEGSGHAVDAAIDRYLQSGKSEDSKVNVDDFMAGMSKSIAENLQDSQAWEEYMIGAVSSMVGMPVFGSQTKNAYLGKGKPVGLAGGLIGNYQDYMDMGKKEHDIAEYLNNRVKDPKFKALYDYLRKNDDYDKALRVALENKDKDFYKDLDAEKLFADINAAASAGHLEEFKQLVGYNKDYSDDELKDIVKLTSRTVTADDQRKQDGARKSELEGILQDWRDTNLENQDEVEDKLNQVTSQIGEIHEKLSQNPDPDTIYTLNEDLARLRTKQNGLLREKQQIMDRNQKVEQTNQQKQAIQKELDDVNKRLQDDESGAKKYEDRQEGPFIDINGQMDVTNPDKMREVLNRNRENMLRGIDDYLKIRNDIDIETDGKLTDDQINFLSNLRFKILDWEHRSDDMAEDLVNTLVPVQPLMDKIKAVTEAELKKAEEALKKAEESLKTASDKPGAEKKVATAKKNLQDAKLASKINNNLVSLFELITGEQDATRKEQKALDRGYGRNAEGKTYTDQREGKRGINSEEAQGILANPLNTKTLKAAIRALGLESAITDRLVSNVDGLHRIASLKKEYNQTVREYLGDPTLINKAFAQSEDRLNQKELDNKAKDLALRIQGVNNMTELNQVLKESNAISQRVTQAALQKAKQEGSEDIKNLISDFEKGSQFFQEFQEQASQLSPDLNAAVSSSAVTSWEEALMDNLDVYNRFVEHMKESADLLENSGNKKAAEALRKILEDLGSARKESATNSHVKNPSKNTEEPEEKKSKKSGKKGPGGSFMNAMNEEKEEEKKEKQQVSPEAQPYIDRMNHSNNSEELDNIFSEGLKAGVPEKELFPIYSKRQAEIHSKNMPADFDSLKSSIVRELQDNGLKKTTIASLSKSLRDRIDAWHSDPAHEKVTDTLIREWVQKVQDDFWEDRFFERTVDDVEEDYEEWKENRGDEMSQETQGNFKSGYQSEFYFYDGSNHPLDYAVPYPGEDDQHKRVRKILKDFLAYQFVDTNWLGYAMKAYPDENIPVHFLKTTERGVNVPNRPITFMAIELTPAVRRSIQKWAYNETKGKAKADISEGIHPVEIGGKQYQIIGVLSINSDDAVSPEVADAFDSLQKQLHDSLQPKITEEREKAKKEGREPEPFVMDESLSSEITKVFTGRLEKYNDADDAGDKVSLFTFMTSQQDGREDRKTSLEWRNGIPFRFGVIVNKELKTSHIEADEVVEAPNEAWCHKKGNNGAILLFVPRADGHLYPLRCTRRSVEAWLDSDDIDGVHTGESLIKDLLDPDSPTKNAYLERIIELIKILTDDSDAYSFNERLDAKYRLAKFFTFGRKNPIQIDVSTMEVMLQLEEEEPIALNKDNLIDNVMLFFNTIRNKERIRFTLPTPTSETTSGSNPDSNLDSRDVIMSGVFEIGLRGFYNFNANVIVKPINGNGVEVKIKTAPEEGRGFTLNQDRGEDRSYTVNGVKKDFHISYEEGVAKITYKDGTEPSNEEQNMVLALENLGEENNKETIMNFVNSIKKELGAGWNTAQKQLLADHLSDALNGYYTVYTSAGPLIYDSKGQELFMLDSAKGQQLRGELKGRVMNYLQMNLKSMMAAAQKKDDVVEKSPVAEYMDKVAEVLKEKRFGGSKTLTNKVVDTIVEGLEAIDPSLPTKDIDAAIDKVFTEAGFGKLWNNFDLYNNSINRVGLRTAIYQNRKPVQNVAATTISIPGMEGNIEVNAVEVERGNIKEGDRIAFTGPEGGIVASGIVSTVVGNDIVIDSSYVLPDGVHYYKVLDNVMPGVTPDGAPQRKQATKSDGDEGKGRFFKDVSLESLKGMKESDSLLGVIAKGLNDRILKVRTISIFNALKQIDENFGIQMSETDLKKKVKGLLGMKKGWNEKLNELVQVLSKCP